MKINYKYKKFISASLVLASGAFWGQLITVIAAPFTTRLFSSAELGMYTLILTTVTMLGPVLSLRYDMSIVVERCEEKIMPIVFVAVKLLGIVSAASSILYCIYYGWVKGSWRQAFMLSGVILILNLLNGALNIIISYNNRYRQYKNMTAGYMARMAVQNFGMILAGLCNGGIGGIILAQVLGYCSSILIQGKKLTAKMCGGNQQKGRLASDIILKYRKQALYSTPAAFLNGLSYSMINFFIENIFGISALGLYSISYRVLGLPSSIISTNISKVYFERASREYQDKNNFSSSYRQTLAVMLIIALPVLLVLCTLSPVIFVIAFGRQWEEAGVFVQILAPMFVLRFITGGVNCSGIIAGKQKNEVCIQLSLVITGILIFLVSKSFQFNIRQYLMLINIIYSAIYLYYIWFFWKCAKGGSDKKKTGGMYDEIQL